MNRAGAPESRLCPTRRRVSAPSAAVLARRDGTPRVPVPRFLLSADACVWEPVGTPEEYLAVNLDPPCLPSLGGSAEIWGGALRTDRGRDCVLDAASEVPADADLLRCVVWNGERLPSGFRARDGIYAGGRFHPCGAEECVTGSGAAAPEVAACGWDGPVSGSTL